MISLAFLKIKDFESLQPGWCHGEGHSFSRETIATARKVAGALLARGFDELDAFPGLNGEIRVTAYDKDRYFEFTIEPDNLVTFLRECGGEEQEYQEGLGLPKCLNVIETMGRRLWYWSALSTPDSSTNTLDVFKALLSSPQATVEYRFSVRNVPLPSAPIFASTSDGSIRALAASPRFSGSSTAASSLRAMTLRSPSAIRKTLATATS